MRGKQSWARHKSPRVTTQTDLDVQAVVAPWPICSWISGRPPLAGCSIVAAILVPFAGREHVVGFFEECIHEANANRGSHPHRANVPSELLIGDGNFGEGEAFGPGRCPVVHEGHS